MTDGNTPAPQVQTSAPAPVAAPAAPAVAETVSSTPAPAAPAAPEAVKTPEAAPPAATLLGAEPPKTETPAPAETPPAEAAKPAEVKSDAPVEADKAPEQKKEEAAQSAEPAPLPTYESFKLPDGVTADEKGLGEFTGILAEIELAKGDHAKMQEAGQKLVDRHIAEVQSALQRQSDFFVEAFTKQKSEWKTATENDQEIGGNRLNTSLGAANEFIRTHGGSAEQQQEFRDLMEKSGIGNHPAMIRMLAKANVAMREGKPLPAFKPESAPKSKIERRYGKN